MNKYYLINHYHIPENKINEYARWKITMVAKGWSSQLIFLIKENVCRNGLVIKITIMNDEIKSFEDEFFKMLEEEQCEQE